jgi:hypothetical protein
MRVGDKIAPLHHPILKPANLPDFLPVARTARPSEGFKSTFIRAAST